MTAQLVHFISQRLIVVAESFIFFIPFYSPKMNVEPTLSKTSETTLQVLRRHILRAITPFPSSLMYENYGT